MYYQGGQVQKANPDPQPETMRSTELVVEQSLTDRLWGLVSLFHPRIDDLISFQTDPADGFLVFHNAGTIETNGAEIELDGRWVDVREARVSYAYQRTEDQQTGEPLANSPEHVAQTNLIATLVWDTLFAGLELRYTSSRRTLLDNRAPAAVITNGTLFGQALSNRRQLSLSVYNVFGVDYGDRGSPEHVQDIIAQDGRTARVKLTYGF